MKRNIYIDAIRGEAARQKLKEMYKTLTKSKNTWAIDDISAFELNEIIIKLLKEKRSNER